MPHHPNTVTVLPKTTDRGAWIGQRRHGLGSSDASIIMGLSPWESPYSLWEQKTGRAALDPPVDHDTEELREWGNRLEPVIRDATAEELGVTIIKPDEAWANRERPWQRANLDGLIPDTSTFCEFKNSTAWNADKWKGQIPDHAEIQVHHIGLVTGWRDAIVAGLIGGNHLSIHRITLNQNILEMMQTAEDEFWRHVEDDTPPDVDWHERTRDALFTEWRQTRTTGSQEVDPDEARKWVEQAREAKEAEDAAKRRRAEAMNHLLKMMGGHEQIATGDTVWARVRHGQLDKRRFQDDHPDLWEQAQTMKPAVDTAWLKEHHPDLFRDYQHITITIPTT
ncbi:YqaJ viral recombinase family protein [Corynebacterium liangguodongii]|nr:YqaJ viral recombinase family protein [Corynebacterium liangguodongii]